jgi:hypothetical protein
MESPQRTSKWPWIVLLILSLAAGTLGFVLSYQDEQTRFLEISAVAESHFIYALQLKDDMAVIDWSKNLEKLPSVLTFQAHSGSKVIAEGGNKEMCPVVSIDGLSFDFPYRWIVHSTFNKETGTPADLTVVFQDFRGPLLWCACLFLVSFITGFILVRFKATPIINAPAPAPIVSATKNLEVVQPKVLAVDEKSLTLTLDTDYLISQATPLAAKAVDRPLSDLVGSHFLDLLPDPSVMKVIAEAKETKFLKPFPSHPHLSALIRPVKEGTILVLEVNDVIEGL